MSETFQSENCNSEMFLAEQMAPHPSSASRSFLNLCFSFNKNSSSEIDFQAKEANQSYRNTNQLSPKLNFCRNFRKPVSSRFNSNRFETEKKTFWAEIEKWNSFQQDDATCPAGRAAAAPAATAGHATEPGAVIVMAPADAGADGTMAAVARTWPAEPG